MFPCHQYMKYEHTGLSGLLMVESEHFEDHRGSFVRTFCSRELDMNVACSYLATNHVAGTLRGMHCQREPYAEDKLVRCVVGSIFDVAVDLRPDSSTYRKWFGIELSSAYPRSLYIPKGFAHGFISLEDNTVIQYHVSNFYVPQADYGVRWDDPAIGIRWPINPKVISQRDREHPLL